MPKVKKSAPKSEKKARVKEEMGKFKRGNLKSSSGQKVKNRDQAVAIAMSESGQSNKDNKSRKMDKKPKGDATTEKRVVKKARKDADRKKRNKGR